MCGINILIYKNQRPQIPEIAKMNLAIKHRGPDDEGILMHKNLVLGHVRLSIQDLTTKGRQPMSNDGRYWIIFNGEIYNFQDIKKELEVLGHKFYSKTDTEVILNAYKEWGFNSFKKFNGMWSFAILDKKSDELILCRDRYGIKPLYYYEDEKKIIFSSEIKGIWASNTEINFDQNKILLKQRSLEGTFNTYFTGINIFPRGHYFRININNFKTKKIIWWKSLDNLPFIHPSYKKNKQKLREVLINATKIRLVSDVKIATSLSGGIDSSIIFSILNNLENKKVNLNPFIYKDSNLFFNEAIDLTNHYNKKPFIVPKANYDLKNIPGNLAKIEVTDNFFSQLEIYKNLKQNNFKVSIDGHGADECLAGYPHDIQYFPMHYHNLILKTYEVLENLKGRNAFIESITKMQMVNKIKGFKLNPINLFYDEKSINETNDLYSDYLTISNTITIPNEVREELNDLKEFDIPFQVMYIQANYGQMQWLLNKWDKAAMANSVEIRSPFLDWNFFQFAISLPSEYKINEGKNKHILRDTFKDFLPNTINKKSFKQGLPPIKISQDKEFIDYLKTGINEKLFKESNIWNGKKILQDFNSLTYYKNNPTINKIWKIFTRFLLKKGLDEIKNYSMQNETTKEQRFNLLTE